MAKILVLDDEHLFVLMLQEMLEFYGHTVIPCSKTQEALDILKADKDIALITTDLAMPGMDGFELISAVRHDLGLDEMPIVIITGSFHQSVLESLPYAEPVRFLRKPFDIKVCIDTINSLLPSEIATV